MEQAGGQPMVDIHYTPIQKAEKTALLIELVPVQRHRELSDVEARERQQHALGELLRGLAHEIKNPLGGLRGAAQLLERELDRDELRDYTRVITAEADRLAGLVDRFQNPARHRGRMAVNIHEVLEHVLSLMAAEYGASLTLERDYDPSIPDLLGDRDRLVQVFLNLVSNAAEAGARRVTLRSRVRRQVPLGLGRQASAVAVEVIDDGPGVPPELRDMLFYPLVSGRSHGSGLGLSIAQGIAAEHGGIIRMDSRPGHTVFTCLLPLHRKDRP